MTWIRAAGCIGAVGVLIGAFGAHGLRPRISPEMMRVFETGSLYHLVHAPALLAIALYGKAISADVRLPCWLITGGITLFSGSLYTLAATGMRGLGAVTPLGGLLLMTGWVVTAWRLGGAR